MRSLKSCLILVIGILSTSVLFVQSLDYPEQKSRVVRSEPNEEGSSSANYQFQYAVKEGAGGNDFGHEEERNGQTTRGRYQVMLPDGRLQVVTYTADENGYRAEVTYENGSGGGRGNSGYAAPAPTPRPSPKPSREYGPPPPSPPPQPQPQNQGYAASSSDSETANSNSFGQRIPGSFVKLRRKINGRNHNYNYNL